MCDTLVALGSATADGATLFAKNSDRHPNEAQAVELWPAARHPPGARVTCTYLELDQVAHTHAVLLCRPFWMWGAEMGVNEHGVAIGNEAVFTRAPHASEAALTGMDLVRLGLERGRSAEEALEVIVALLERHGQGGECGYDGSLRYHNGFLLADAAGAWVLETAGRHWVAERVRDVRSISNGLSVRGEGDRRSAGLAAYARERRLVRGDTLDFARDLADPLYGVLAAGAPRRARTEGQLCALAGRLDAGMLMAMLRGHGAPPGVFDPARGLLGGEVCMHASFGPLRAAHTVGSLVCRLDAAGPTVFVTGTSTPCTSIFVPVFLEHGLPEALRPTPGARPDGSLFWRHERLARAIGRDHRARIGRVAMERDDLERSLTESALTRSREVAEESMALAEAARARWTAAVEGLDRPGHPRSLYHRAWARFDRRARRGVGAPPTVRAAIPPTAT